MQEADNGMNEVLVVSPILEEYIRKTYPRFKINSSTCKEIRDIDALNAELERDYYLVALDYNMNNQWDILKKVKKPEKCEVLVNALCVPNCPRRGAHYKNVAQNHRIELENRKLPEDKKIPIIHQNPFPLIKAILHTGRGNGAGGESKCLYQQYQNDSSKHCFYPYRNTGYAQFI